MRSRKSISIRRARPADASDIRALQNAAFRIRARADYDAAEINSFLVHAGTLETALIEDGTYFVAEIEGEIVASGGWSSREPGYSQFEASGAALPLGSAVILGIYVDPAFAGTGLAKRLIGAIEEDIATSGFTRVHIATTYGGMPFLTSRGYKPTKLVALAFPDSRELHGVAMSKGVSASLAMAA